MSKPQLVANDYDANPRPDDRRLGQERFGSAGALSGGGGDDGMNDLRVRVAILETHTENIRVDIREIKPDVKDIRDRLAKLEATVSHLPGMKTIWTSVGAVVTAIVVFTTFQQQIRTFLGLIPTLPQ